MFAGISLYIGLDNTFEENMLLLHTAASMGAARVFTSFHIPETNRATFHEEVIHTLKNVSTYDMDVISDISPNTLSLLGMDSFEPYILQKMGIKTVRVDFGFSPKEIAKLTFSGLNVQLNASTVTEDLLQELERYSANFECIDALHNFYPRENTGISEDFFTEKTRLLHEYGIKPGAFVASHNRPRSPIKAGLPTLEEHRYCSVDFAARHLTALGADYIFIGDSLPTTDEILAISKIKPKQITLRPYLFTENIDVCKLLAQPYRTRPDDAADVYRIDGSRELCKKFHLNISPENNSPRETGCITIDNDMYGRYQGEIQIMKKDLPADSRVNVIGHLSKQEQKLLEYLKPGTNLQFLI